MKLIALPAFTDNYIWMLHDGRKALVVDPGDASPVIAALQELHLSLDTILVTHHHPDHVAGLAALKPYLQGHVWGPRGGHIAGITQAVGDGDVLSALGLTLDVWAVPGHTLDHLAFVARPAADTPWPGHLAWCGDTLFSAGCGRLFEGTPAQMHASLSRLAGLPADTWLCPTHEYTVANLRFALEADPDNADVSAHLDACLTLRAQQRPTLPTDVGQERRINPFLRTRERGVIAQALRHKPQPDDGPVAVLAALREWKNEHRA